MTGEAGLLGGVAIVPLRNADVCCGNESLRGEAPFGGEGTFGGLALGGEYVRGEPRVCGDHIPVGDAWEGNATVCLSEWVTTGVATAIWSGSILNSRMVTDGSNLAVEGTSRHIPVPTGGLASLPFDGAGSLPTLVFTCTPWLRVSTGTVCTPRPRYFFPLLDDTVDVELVLLLLDVLPLLSLLLSLSPH